MQLSRRKFIRYSALGTGLTIMPAWLKAGATLANDKINLGFIGCGRQSGGLGRRFAQQPNLQIVAACDVYAAKVAHFIKEKNEQYAEARGKGTFSGVQEYTDFEALLDHPGLDAVVVATPDHWHATICVAALNKGLHVYCEKPLAHTVEEGRAIVAASTRSGKVVQTGSMQRSQYRFRHAVELIRNGYLGELQEVLVSVGPPPKTFDLSPEAPPQGLDWQRWVGPSVDRGFHPLLAPKLEQQIWPKWRDYAEYGGGMVTDWGAHMFDIVQWAVDMDHAGPVSFSPPSGADKSRGASFRYANGLLVKHENFGRGNSVRFIGSEGSLDVSRQFLDSSIEGLVDRSIQEGEQRVYFSESQVGDFLSAIEKGHTPICPAEVGHRTASICNLLNICYRLDRPLSWDPKKERIHKDKVANRLLGEDYRLKL